MYSTTIVPDRHIKSDGQLHQPAPAEPLPVPARPKPQKPSIFKGISSEQILIIAIAYVLLQSKKPDWLLIIALAYILL